MGGATRRLPIDAVNAIFKELDVRDIAWFLAGADQRATLSLHALPRWGSLRHLGADVLLADYVLPGV